MSDPVGSSVPLLPTQFELYRTQVGAATVRLFTLDGDRLFCLLGKMIPGGEFAFTPASRTVL